MAEVIILASIVHIGTILLPIHLALWWGIRNENKKRRQLLRSFWNMRRK